MKKVMLAVLVTCLSLPAFAVETVTPVPMVRDNMPAVGDISYQSATPMRMPLITWGADLATIFANGGELTSSGSLFDDSQLKIQLYREDAFRNQVRDFRAGKTPFLRGTADMVAAASEALCDDARTCPRVFYNLSRSAGGDILLVNTSKGVTDLGSLKGKAIGLQLDGPHMFLLVESLKLAGLSVSDVTIKWYKDLGLDGVASAAHAFQAGEVDAAFVIYPDALELLGGDGKVAGAKNVFSTKSLDRVIFDVMAVRPDFADAHPEVIEKMTNALLRANESLATMLRENGEPSSDTHPKKSDAYKKVASDGAKLLFGVEGDVFFDNTVWEMYAFDLKMQGWTGNVKFLTGGEGGRELVSLNTVVPSAAEAFQTLGLVNAASAVQVSVFSHDYAGLQNGLTENFAAVAPSANAAAAQQAIETMSSAGTLESQKIVSFEIRFGANEFDFPIDLYGSDFERVIQVMARAGGAVVAVEGHSGTYEYLVQKYGKTVVPADIYRQTAQSASNLSLRRAQAVISALQSYAEANSYDVQFNGVVPIGHGIEKPAAGLCQWKTREGSRVNDPCGPEDKSSGAAWQAVESAERRVVFTVVNVEGEAEVFSDNAF